MPGDHDGDGIVCPSCRRMLRIPATDEETAPLVAPLKRVDFADDDTPLPRGEKRSRSKRKKRKKPSEAETPGWDASAGIWRASRKKGKRTLQSVAGWTLVVAAMFGSAFLLVKLDEPGKTAEGGTQVDVSKDPVQAPLLLPDEELEEPIELPKIMQRDEEDLLALAQPIAEAFLTATSIDQILPLVRDRERLKPHILAFYPDGKIEPSGLAIFNSTGRVSYKDSFASISIQTPDFRTKQLAFVDGADGLKVDWESWVGWSEMPWDKLIESRPTRPVLVRATLNWIEYYNFDFSEESKWRSFRLVSPDGEHALYGYAERNSLLDQRLRPSEKTASVAVTLRIRFPKDGEARNQAVIEEYVADGWVVPDKAE